jgi:hypothetical protein
MICEARALARLYGINPSNSEEDMFDDIFGG